MNRTLPILAATMIFLTGCPHDGTRPGTPIDVTRITPDAPALVTTSGLAQAQRTAVFDQATLTEVWRNAFVNREPVPAPPTVDFEREFVIVVALGERTSGGFTIEVARAFGEGSEITAEVIATSPGKDCVVAAVMSQPVDFVKLPRPGPGEVRVHFLDWSVMRDCGR